MKNPWMSMWLSAANSAAGATRGFWTAELHRQQQAFAKEVIRASSGLPAKKRKSSSRKSK